MQSTTYKRARLSDPGFRTYMRRLIQTGTGAEIRGTLSNGWPYWPSQAEREALEQVLRMLEVQS